MRLRGANYHMREKAAREVSAARAAGLSAAPCCERCGRVTKTLGHHADYSAPLDIEWLCGSCHTRAHRVGPIARPSAADLAEPPSASVPPMAARMRDARVASRTTLEDAARVFDVTPVTVRNWEMGVSSPRIDLIDTIFALYELADDDLDWFLCLDDMRAT